jgi:alkanesulfonate monooxygenase SsuD/methylene tetrahydromethanopterin reductase-like flavin-dependent oxidoreductase (luciferase family)
VRYALFLPPFRELADPRVLAELAVRAEAAGWDGLFVWDHVHRAPVGGVGDPWIGLAAVAAATERLIVGPMVTPLARRRPQIVARQATGLDQLSAGRLVLGVGLGLDGRGRELSAFGEELDGRRRAALLDESLEVLDALWSGQEVHHAGTAYLADGVRFLPRPLQRPRVPVWVAGRHPNTAPMRRAARWDGAFPIDLDHPGQLAEMVAMIAQARGDAGMEGFEVAAEGWPGDDPRPYAAAGATWWLVRFDPETISADGARAVIDSGPPR